VQAGQACKKINESGLTCLITALAGGLFPTECQLKKLCSFFAGGSGYKKGTWIFFYVMRKKSIKGNKSGKKIFTKQNPIKSESTRKIAGKDKFLCLKSFWLKNSVAMVCILEAHSNVVTT
jgi:hypothetical protein